MARENRTSAHTFHVRPIVKVFFADHLNKSLWETAWNSTFEKYKIATFEKEQLVSLLVKVCVFTKCARCVFRRFTLNFAKQKKGVFP